jgi:hypothetical protein
MAVVVEIDGFGFRRLPSHRKISRHWVVDADRSKPRQVAAQLFEVIAERHPQVLINCPVVDHLELAKVPAFEVRRNVPRLGILDEGAVRDYSLFVNGGAAPEQGSGRLVSRAGAA